MKKSEITSPGHLIAYYTAKIKEADDIANNCEDIYRLIIHYAKLQEARRQVNKEKELLAQGYEDIRQDIARKDAQLPLKLITSEVKYIDTRMLKIKKGYKELRDYYTDNNNAKYCETKIQEKFSGVNDLYAKFNKHYKAPIEKAIKANDWANGLKLINELEENPFLEMYVTINRCNFYGSDKLSNMTQEIIFWKRNIIKKIPQKEYLILDIASKKEKMKKADKQLIALHKEALENFKKIDSNYDDTLFSNPEWNKQDEHLISKITEIHRERGYLGNSIITDSNELKKLKEKAISQNR